MRLIGAAQVGERRGQGMLRSGERRGGGLPADKVVTSKPVSVTSMVCPIVRQAVIGGDRCPAIGQRGCPAGQH
jgi:hypothetical protein